MNELRGRKVRKIETPVPGCLGRMVNLFDLGTAVNGNKLLTDTPHHDGSSLSRSRSDLTRMPTSPSNEGYSESELIMSDLRRSAYGTPMKKLIAREMSKEVEHNKQSPTNVVAKLMGLETLPETTATQRSKSRTSSYSSPHHRQVPEVQNYRELSREFKDVFEMWQSPPPPQKVTSSPRKGRYEESTTEKLVRQKFVEAKRLVTDDNLHRSKEFQGALDVLSSNKDLFVKLLQESNSFSQQLAEFQCVVPHPEAKRITVLRPSKAVETEKFVVQGRKNKQVNRDLVYSSSYANRGAEEHPLQPTRIVVLKPTQDKKAVSSFGDVESSEAAKEVTRQVRESLMGRHRRNETQSSSVLSNGYIGDDSSFNDSDNEEEEPAGNLSDDDCEIVSPASRHSWDCVPNRFETSFSPSSFSRASFSPESSVCREAKKRLSERWTLMSVTRSTQQPPHRHVPRASSTLGEMLALSETKATTTGSDEKSNEETRVSTSCVNTEANQAEMASENILARSKSAPHASLGGEASVLGTETSLKSSWKVSNLFLFKNKKASKEKRDATPSSSVTLREDRLLSGDCLPLDASQQQSVNPTEEELTTPNPNTSENQDQPSPISVLFPPFEEEVVGIPELATTQGEGMSLKSNLIGKSPPIGSVARILSWDDGSCTDNISKPSTGIHDEEDWYSFTETLLQAAGFSRGCCCTVSLDPLKPRLHLPNSPLDPSLRDKYANSDITNNNNNNIKEFIHEGKRRQHRSTRKLIFDRINSIVSETTTPTTACTGGCGSPRFDLVEHVWAQIKDWVSDEGDYVEDMNGNSLAAESLVKEEIAGRTWTRSLQAEVDGFGIDIERTLLQELVEEAVIDLTR